ncbi:MAG: pyridoxamine 5'-phosphate oxidase family protein [Actinomycetota bacterium]|nr:pyridoxamine 5'-phosphate oxidase family protein [Actinomycetota bacterium]
MRPDDPAAVSAIGHAMVARIATLSRTGRPHVNPLYFVYHSGTIYLGTTDRTLAARNVAANPRVSLLFTADGAEPGQSLLRVRGNARLRVEPDLFRWYARRDTRKYILTLPGLVDMVRHARLLPVMRHYLAAGDKGRRCVIEVQPTDAEFLASPG